MKFFAYIHRAHLYLTFYWVSWQTLYLQISGLGILLAGAIILSDLYEFDHFVEAKLYAPPAVLIATGIIIFLIAILGCFGIIKESPALLFAVFINKMKDF